MPAELVVGHGQAYLIEHFVRLALTRRTGALVVAQRVVSEPAIRGGTPTFARVPGAYLTAMLIAGWAVAECFFYERHEGASLRARASPRRKNRPQLYGRQGPVPKYRLDDSALQFRRKHPFGRDGETETREHCLTHPFRRSDAHTAVHSYGSFYAAFPERPDRSSTARVINYGLVRSEVRGRFRLAVLFEISGGAKHSSRALSDFSRDQRRVIERTHAQRYIHSSFDEIDVSIIENDFQFERGMLRKERRESWHDV